MTEILTDALTLPTAGLFSRFGFSDGDCPDEVLDWCEDHEEGLIESYLETWEWRPVLIDLVSEHLLPWLEARVTVTVLGTNHNPIRARTVDGVDVDLEADNDRLVESLPVTSIGVTRDVVLATIRRHARRGGARC